MTIPDYQSLMEPVLRVLVRDGAMSVRDLADRVGTDLCLTDTDRRQSIQSGMGLLQNRTHWAVTYLFKAKAVSRPQRGHVEVTDRGRALLGAGGPIRNSALEQFPEYRAFYDKYRSKKAASSSTLASYATPIEEETPDDLIARAELAARADLSADLLEKLRTIHPVAFEKLVLKLLQAMDYGISGAIEHSGRPGDGGIDGIITQDALGLDRIYIQAKRYAAGNAVQSPDIRNFLGALMGQQGDRGVFLTTSTFSTGAIETAKSVAARVVLIDGERLAELLIDRGVGVQAQRVASLHRIDEDFFETL